MSEPAFLESPELAPTGRYVLAGDNVTIGRAYDCDLVLNAPQISRHHARILRRETAYTLEDLHSANGTFLNDTPIRSAPLADGDQIRVGSLSLTFRQPLSGGVRLSDDTPANSNLTIALPLRRLDDRAPDEAGARDSGRVVQVVLDAARALLGAGDLDHVLSGVMDLVFDYLKADRGFLMLHDPESGQLVPRVIRHRGSRRPNEPEITCPRTIANKVFEEGVSILTTDATQDNRFDVKDSIVLHQVRSCMCAPLWDQQKTIGILYVDCRFFEGYFQETDLDLLSTIAVIAAIAIEQFRLNAVIAREQRIRENLQRYHSPSVIDRLIQAGGLDSLAPEDREITVLFADLVGFTPLAEGQEPSRVAHILNQFFDAVTEVIFFHHGTLDKYIGDAVMAVFGAPLPQPDHASRAVRAAVEMFEAIEEINQTGQLPVALRMRIGINTGRVVAGDFGSRKRLDYTVLGSTVNIASRLESSVAQPGQIVIGEPTAAQIGDEFTLENLGRPPLRGVSTPLTLFRVTGRARPAGTGRQTEPIQPL